MPGSNPFLHQAIIAVVDNQLREDDPPETGETLRRLIAEGHAEDEAKRLIGAVVVIEIYGMLKQGHAFDHDRFVAALRRLPELPLGDEQ